MSEFRASCFGWNLSGARHSAKADLPEAFLCRVSPGLAPGKEFLCRVPDKKHPVNFFLLPANQPFPVVNVLKT
jgi:hypothetical protein